MNDPVTINGLVTLTAYCRRNVRPDLCRLWCNADSKGVTVRQALASIAHRSHSFPSNRSLVIAARRRRSAWRAAAPASANAKYAAIVVDANTGKTLFSSNADAPRYPASLTKMMTLYLIFEALAERQDQEDNQGAVLGECRGRAADQARRQGRRLGHRRDGDLSLVTNRPMTRRRRSANCSAARKNGFARMMTAKARAARHDRHHLPQRLRPAQPRPAPTARDMATLGIALREHFPQYYPLFLDSARSLTASSASPTTTACSAASRASTASRPATPAPPASTSSRRCPTATAASSPSSWAAQSGGSARQAHGRADQRPICRRHRPAAAATSSPRPAATTRSGARQGDAAQEERADAGRKPGRRTEVDGRSTDEERKRPSRNRARRQDQEGQDRHRADAQVRGRRAGLCRADPGAHGRHRPGQHRLGRRPAGRSRSPRRRARPRPAPS